MRRRYVAIGAILVALLALLAIRWPAAEAPPASAPPARVVAAPAPVAASRPVARPPPAPAVAPSPAPAGQARCEVGRALEGRSCSVVLGAPEVVGGVLGEGPLSFRVAPGSYDGSAFTFTPPPDVSEGAIVCGGTARIPITWQVGEDGAVTCTTGALPPPADAPVFGTVRGAADLPEGTVFLEGCGARRDDPVDADGGFFFQGSAGPCRLRAWRQAGALRLPGPWVEVELVAGVDVEVALEIPTYEPAGMGIAFEPGEDGVKVLNVHPGTPAAAAGLAPGDTIHAIDGAPTAGMGMEDFLAHGIGPEGSAVRLEGTTAEGEPFDVTVTRARISAEAARRH